MLRGFRDVDEVITLDRDATKTPLRAPPEIFKLLRRLRAENFSLAVDFQGYGETAWLSWLSGAPERFGNVYSAGREWLYTRGVRHNKQIHQADWNLSLLEQCGLRSAEIRNEFFLPADAIAAARIFFSENRLSEKNPTLFIQAFTSSPQKDWPLKNYLALARHFQSRGVQIIFGGGPAEIQKLEPARAAGFIVSAGLPLMTSAGLVKLSTLTVGGDTGLLHLAVAMGRRVLMLMSAVGRTHPFQHADWTITPANKKNISEIQIEKVIESAGNVFC